MALQKQLATILCRGLDTQADPKASPPGTFDILENLYCKRSATEGVEIRKRFGVTAKTASILGGGSLPSSARRLSTFNDEQIQLNGSSLYSYSSTAGAWSNQGILSPCSGTVEVAGTSGVFLSSQASCPDMAIGGGYALIAWATPDVSVGAINCTLIDLATGDRILNTKLLIVSLAVNPVVRVIALATKFMIITWSATAGGTVQFSTISYAAPSTVTGATNLVTDLNTTNPRFDVIKNAGLDGIAAVYNKTVAGMKGIVANNVGTVTGSFTDADIPDKAVGGLTWDGSDNVNYFAYVGAAATTKVVSMTNAGAIGTKTVFDTPAACRNVSGYRSGTTNTVYVEVGAANSYDTLVRRSVTGGGGVGVVWSRSVGLGSRPFQIGTTWYLTLAYQSPKQSVYFVVDDTTVTTLAVPAVVLRALYGLAGGLTAQTSIVPSVAIQSSTMAIAPALSLAPQSKASATGTYVPTLLRMDFSGSGFSSPKRLGDNLHVPGGVVKIYDSAGTSECGFHLFPETPAAPTLSAGTFTGTYQFRWCYVFIDGRGQQHRSAPSDPVTVTMAAQQAAFLIPALRIDNHNPPGASGGGQSVIVEQYRTLPSETTFFLDNSQLIINLGSPIVSDTISSVASVSDALLPSQPKLYTTGNVLPHICPPSARLMEVWRNRLFLAGTDNPLELWVSNEYVGDGVSFSDALVIAMESDGGAITALAESDDRLVIFKRNAIYLLSGLGPTLTGSGQFDQPTRLTAAVGAVSQNGVLKTPQGILFKSTRGWHILPNGGGLPVRLKGVEAFESLTLQGATLVDDLEQARIVTAEGTTLVYHYGLPDDQGRGRWSTFTGQAAVDTIFWNSKWVYLASNGVVQEENGAYNDNGATITSKARYAWLNLAGLLGRHRLYRAEVVADWRATFTATVRHAVNFDSTVIQSASLGVTTSSPVPIGLINTRGDAVSHQITVEETSTTEGFRLSALVLELAGKGGAGKLNVGQAFQ